MSRVTMVKSTQNHSISRHLRTSAKGYKQKFEVFKRRLFIGKLVWLDIESHFDIDWKPDESQTTIKNLKTRKCILKKLIYDFCHVYIRCVRRLTDSSFRYLSDFRTFKHTAINIDLPLLALAIFQLKATKHL